MEPTRRDFGRVAGACAAAGLAAAAQDPETDGTKRIGYCIVALGRISCPLPGPRNKAEKMAAQYGVPGP